MSSNLRRRFWCGCFCGLTILVMLGLAGRAGAVSISGIMIYSTDDFGNPNGYETYNGTFQAQMWRTLARAGIEWYGLGVTSGLPPKSIDDPFLNFPDFSVDLPLDEGENYFTLFAEPGPLTATDDYQRFLISVYFDGNLEEPGISVLFPRYAEPDGSAVAEARPNDDQRYGFMLQKISTPTNTYYDDGIHRVSVLRASLLPPERANMSVDRLRAHALAPGGVDGDWIGAMVVSVQPSESFGAGGGVPAPAGGSGGGGRGGGLGGGLNPVGGGGVYAPPGAVGQPAPILGDGAPGAYEEAGSGDGAGASGDVWHRGDAAEATPEDDDPQGTPTPADLTKVLEQWLRDSAAPTPSPGADDEGAEQTPSSTGTLQSTGTPATPTPAGSSVPTTPIMTPTPVITPSGTPAETQTPHPAAD